MIWVIGPALREVVIRDLHENAQGRLSDLQWQEQEMRATTRVTNSSSQKTWPGYPSGPEWARYGITRIRV